MKKYRAEFSLTPNLEYSVFYSYFTACEVIKHYFSYGNCNDNFRFAI